MTLYNLIAILIIAMFTSCNVKSDANDQLNDDTSAVIQSETKEILINPIQCTINEYYDFQDSAFYYYYKASDEDIDHFKANYYFKRAIHSVDHTFGIIYSLAFKTALSVKDYKWAEKLAIRMAKGGVPEKFFINKIKDQSNYSWDKFYDNYSNYHEFFLANYNIELRNRLLTLIKNDSLFSAIMHFGLDPNAKRFINNPPEGSQDFNYTYDSIVTRGKEISNEFFDIVATHGLPSEKEVGFKMSRGELSLYHYTVLIHHIRVRGDSISINEVNKAFCNGAIEQSSYHGVIEILTNFRGTTEELTNRYLKNRESSLQQSKTD